MQLVARDVDHVALPHLVHFVAKGDARTPGDDHDPVVVRVALAGGAPAGRDIEVPDAIARGALGLADQLVLAHARQLWVTVLLGGDPLPPVSAAAMDDAHRARALAAARGHAVGV